MFLRGSSGCVLIALLVCLLLTSCSANQARGKASAAPPRLTDVVPGLPARGGYNGLRPAATEAHRDIEGTDNGEVDKLAAGALADVELFWKEKLPKYFNIQLPPLHEVDSWDDQDPRAIACGHTGYHLSNAMYCLQGDAIAWDRRLVDMLDKTFPPMAIVVVLAHEYGHRVQFVTKLVDETATTIVKEQQADCFAGFFIRWVTEDHAPHFQLNTTDGLNTAMAALLWLRDPTEAALMSNYKKEEHGSGFDRISAFQMGFADGGDACKKINQQEIDKRRSRLPTVPTEMSISNIPINQDNLPLVLDAMGKFFRKLAPDRTPYAVIAGGIEQNCPNQKTLPAAMYCVATNKITMDIPALAKIGTPVSDLEGTPYSFTGDASAFVIIAARYGLAYVHSKGLATKGPAAALTAVCLAGAFLTSIVGSSSDRSIQFSPGDLDKAISELIFDGFAASDIDGKIIPSGFTRISAFRTGAINHQNACLTQYKP